MKLVDILARDLKEWPEIMGDSVGQAADGTLHNEDVAWLVRSDKAYELCDSFVIDSVTRAEWQAAVDALKNESASSPLLSVGIDVEVVEAGLIWDAGLSEWIGRKAKVLALYENCAEQPMAAIGIPTGETISLVVQGLRPVLTSEQIAKRERSKACDAMYGVILGLPQERRHNRSDICEALYDAGYKLDPK